MSEPVHIHQCCTPGLTMDGAVLEHIRNPNSRHGHYWKATARIGSIFGSEVEGELVGYGQTQEQALQRLSEERHKLHESLWY